MKPECERCGSCCLQIDRITDIPTDDIERWVNQSRVDILTYCDGWNDDCYEMMMWNEDALIKYLCEETDRAMWVDWASRNMIPMCPFLRKKYGKNRFECMIHETKPEVCRDYICQKDIKGIVKKSFACNLREYRRKRKKYRSFIRTSPFIGNPEK